MSRDVVCMLYTSCNNNNYNNNNNNNNLPLTPDAVSWFSPGSYECRPKTENKQVGNLFMAGDWVRLERDIEATTAKGLCQERAFVTGYYQQKHYPYCH